MIEINKISKRFGEFVCLSDVTLSIPDGSIYGLIGENGAGKVRSFGFFRVCIKRMKGKF